MCYRNWDRALSTVVRLQAGQLRNCDSIPSTDKKCFFPLKQPDWPWACPVSYSIGTRGSFPKHKLLGHETYHSPPSKAEDEYNYISTPQHAFMVSTKPNVLLQLLLQYDVLFYFTKIISSLKMWNSNELNICIYHNLFFNLLHQSPN